MFLDVDSECRKLGLRASSIVFRGVGVADRPAELHGRIASEAKAVRERYVDPQEIRAIPEVTYFQEILRKVGVNPRREQPSVERLLIGIHKRGDLPRINALVDAYNLVSVRSLCSMGAHDLDKIAPPAILRLLTGNETFTPLGKPSPVPVTPGEYAYVDALNRVLCRLDLVQADFSKVTVESRNVLLIVETTEWHAPERSSHSLAEVRDLVGLYCGGIAE